MGWVLGSYRILSPTVECLTGLGPLLAGHGQVKQEGTSRAQHRWQQHQPGTGRAAKPDADRRAGTAVTMPGLLANCAHSHAVSVGAGAAEWGRKLRKGRLPLRWRVGREEIGICRGELALGPIWQLSVQRGKALVHGVAAGGVHEWELSTALCERKPGTGWHQTAPQQEDKPELSTGAGKVSPSPVGVARARPDRTEWQCSVPPLGRARGMLPVSVPQEVGEKQAALFVQPRAAAPQALLCRGQGWLWADKGSELGHSLAALAEAAATPLFSPLSGM